MLRFVSLSLDSRNVEPVLREILEWTQDLNWPVAQIFVPFLVAIGSSASEQVRDVLNGDDSTWKYSLLAGVVVNSPSLAKSLGPELNRLSVRPTTSEREEGVGEIASQILQSFGSETEA
jgi:hypothetical protein